MSSVSFFILIRSSCSACCWLKWFAARWDDRGTFRILYCGSETHTLATNTSTNFRFDSFKSHLASDAHLYSLLFYWPKAKYPLTNNTQAFIHCSSNCVCVCVYRDRTVIFHPHTYKDILCSVQPWYEVFCAAGE